MRTRIFVTLAIFAIGFTPADWGTVYPASGNGPSQRLESYVGKYPSELLKGVPSLKQRLKTLLGANYSSFMQRLQTEVPIEKDQGTLIGRGCQAHSCGEEEAVFAIDLPNGKLHCAILSQRYGGKFKVFSEDKAHIPPALTRAMQRP